MTAPARKPIDWSALRRRVDSARASLDRELAPDAERQRAILRARARIAAVVRSEATDTAPGLRLVEFSLLHETYGLDAAFVREVAHLDSYLPLPGAPPFVVGVVPLRGRMLTVVNLKPFFDLPARGLTNLNKIVVLEDGTTEFGLLADAVAGGLRHVPATDLKSPPSTFTGVRAHFTRGIAPDSLIVLDAGRLLRDPHFRSDAGR